MSNYRKSLPQLGEQLFLTDGGLETTLIFHEGVELPQFASFVLLAEKEGVATLQDYYRRYLDIAVQTKSGFILEGATWRASKDWGRTLGYDEDDLADINRNAVRLMKDLRDEYKDAGIPIVISGNVGPRGDGYVAGAQMSIDEAAGYHEAQIRTLSQTAADMITALTLTYAEEAAGIVQVAKQYGLPAAVGFTTETDGKLPNGTLLRDAIELVDREIDGGPAYYIVNCAHTEHFSEALIDGEPWTRRIRGIRANASRLSHAELDEAEELDDGDPEEFGELHLRLRERFPRLSVFGGCCGTDHRHVRAVRLAIG